MRSRRTLIALLTFLAGLYFVLDYLIPPAIPIHRGVVASVTAATITLDTGATYRIENGPGGTPEVTTSQRDTTGALKQVPLLVRKVRVGARINVRRGPFPFGSMATGARLVTKDGVSIPLQPGESVLPVGGQPSTAPIPTGTPVMIEIRDARVQTLDHGSVILISGSAHRTVPLAGNTVILRMSRFDPPIEVQPTDLQVGDTVKVGPGTGFADYRDTTAQFNLVISTFAFGMGLLSLGAVHGRNLLKRPAGWYTSLFFFASVVIGVLAGQFKYSDPGTQQRAFSDLIVLQVLSAVGSAIFSLLAFYMASASYRAFRVRTLEAGLMMASALIVMLGQTPFGTYLTSWMGEQMRALWLPNVAGWILRVPTTAIFRGLTFGIMMGAIATALRYWLSAERSAAMRDE